MLTGTTQATDQPAVLPLMEDFYTLQGEGFHQGRPAYFIRLGGCDVGCHWCDVKDSWDASKFPSIKIADILEKVCASGSRIAVVTGGEPFMHDLTALTESLKTNNIGTHVETAGVYPVTGRWDWICLSPKKFKEPLKEIYAQANELKVIIFNKSDFEWAEQLAENVNLDCHLYLQPEWSKHQVNNQMIIEYIKCHPRWRLSLQVHKYLNIP